MLTSQTDVARLGSSRYLCDKSKFATHTSGSLRSVVASRTILRRARQAHVVVDLSQGAQGECRGQRFLHGRGSYPARLGHALCALHPRFVEPHGKEEIVCCMCVRAAVRAVNAGIGIISVMEVQYRRHTIRRCSCYNVLSLPVGRWRHPPFDANPSKLHPGIRP